MTELALPKLDEMPGWLDAQREQVRDIATLLMAGWAKAPAILEVFLAVMCERYSQELVHGNKAVARNGSLDRAVAILAEEYGEVAQQANVLADRKAPDRLNEWRLLRYECIQVAAVAVAMVERLDRGDWL